MRPGPRIRPMSCLSIVAHRRLASFSLSTGLVLLSTGLVLTCTSDKLGPDGRLNRPPVARIEGPASGSEGAGISLSAAGSRDPDGDPFTILCLSGDGRIKAPGFQYPPYRACDWSYPEDGSYLASVIVSDGS